MKDYIKKFTPRQLDGKFLVDVTQNYCRCSDIEYNPNMCKSMKAAIMEVYPQLITCPKKHGYNKGAAIIEFAPKQTTRYIMIYRHCSDVLVYVMDNYSRVVYGNLFTHYTYFDLKKLLNIHEEATGKSVYVISNRTRYVKTDNSYYISDSILWSDQEQDTKQNIAKFKQSDTFSEKFTYMLGVNMFDVWLAWTRPIIEKFNTCYWLDNISTDIYTNKTATEIYKVYCMAKQIDFNADNVPAFGRILNQKYNHKCKRINNIPTYIYY